MDACPPKVNPIHWNWPRASLYQIVFKTEMIISSIKPRWGFVLCLHFVFLFFSVVFKRKEECIISEAFLKPILHRAQPLFLPSYLDCVISRWSEKNSPSGCHRKTTRFRGPPAATWTKAMAVELDKAHVITASEIKTPSGSSPPLFFTVTLLSLLLEDQ